MEEKNFIEEINRKISNIETHIINMIIPLQHISHYADPTLLKNLNDISSRPLMIDDTGLKQVLNSFKELMEKFSKGTWAVDPDKVYDKLKENYGMMISQNVELQRITRKLDELEKEVKKQKFFVNISGVSCQNNSSQVFTKEQEEFLKSDIWDVETTVRLANLLHKHKLKKWRDVYTHGKVNFYKIDNFGKKAIEELTMIFKDHDIEF